MVIVVGRGLICFFCSTAFTGDVGHVEWKHKKSTFLWSTREAVLVWIKVLIYCIIIHLLNKSNLWENKAARHTEECKEVNKKKNPPKLKSRGTEKLIERSSWWQTRGSPTERCFYSMWSSCGWCWWWLQQSVRPDLSPPPSLLSPPLSAGFPLRPPSRQLLAWPSGCCWIRRFGRLLEGLLPQWASACWSLGRTRSPVPGESEHESVGKVNGRARRKPVLNRKLAALVF